MDEAAGEQADDAAGDMRRPARCGAWGTGSVRTVGIRISVGTGAGAGTGARHGLSSTKYVPATARGLS